MFDLILIVLLLILGLLCFILDYCIKIYKTLTESHHTLSVTADSIHSRICMILGNTVKCESNIDELAKKYLNNMYLNNMKENKNESK